MKKVLVCAVVAGLALIGGQAFLTQPPRASLRRPLAAAEVQRLRAASPNAGEWKVRALEAVGVSSKLDSRQLDYFRRLGTEETYLLRYLAEYGVTPEESEALAAEGVQMALSDPSQMDVFHWAALADTVVAGEVEDVRGNPAGPYHTYVDVRVERRLKQRSGAPLDGVTGALLRTGPRLHAEGGDVHHAEAMDEPNLKSGEKVVVFLSREPISLVSQLATALANHGGTLPERFESEFGSHRDLVRALDTPIDLEVVLAYKIVGDQAVIKAPAYRVPTPYDVIDLATLTSRIERIAAAQERARPARR
jgi:hypothetical protein